MRISDWSSDVCSSDLVKHVDNDSSSSRFRIHADGQVTSDFSVGGIFELEVQPNESNGANQFDEGDQSNATTDTLKDRRVEVFFTSKKFVRVYMGQGPTASDGTAERSEEHPSELQYLMRLSYSVFC